MITDNVLRSYVKAVREVFPASYPIWPRAYFDQNLEFERLREDLESKDADWKRFSADRNGNWLAFVYNRGPVDRSFELGRQQAAKAASIDKLHFHEYGWVLVKTPFSIRIYSPSIPWIEQIEEYFAAVPPPSAIDVAIKLPPEDQEVIIKATLDAAVPQAIVKLPEQTSGSLSTLQLDVAMNYPVIVHKVTLPAIREVILDVYIGEEPDAESRILQLRATA